MIKFTITADGTSAAKVFDEGYGAGSRRATARAKSSNWESASIDIVATVPNSSAAMPIAGLEDLTADVSVIPVDIPRGASLTAVCTGKSGSTPIYIEID